jgi:hypothetical protein
MCLRDCSLGQKNYSDGTIFAFKAGQTYGTVYTPWYPRQQNRINEENNSSEFFTCGDYKGMVSAEFINSNFMIYEDYKKNYREVNDLFESFMKL